MKEHYKLYKAGKLWVTACIVTLGILAGSTAYADQLTTTDSQPTVTNVANSKVNSTQSKGSVNTAATANNTQSKTAGNTTTSTNNTQSTATAGTNNTQSKTTNGATTTGEAKQPNNSAAQQPVSKINDYSKASNANIWTNANGDKANGWQVSGNNWYYFNNGQLTSGWQYVDHAWYYMSNTNNVMQTGLQKINNSLYYLNEQHDGTYGAMQSGWQKVNNHWYYFAGPSNGAAYTGWQFINHNWYYFNNNGQAASDWQRINNRWYYFDPQNAWTLRGWQYLGNHWYYFDPNQTWMDTGWQYLGNRWYYLEPGNGAMVTGVHNVNGSLYYFQNSGAMATFTGWQNLNNHWYYFNNNNTLKTNWLFTNGRWYYFNPTNGQAETGWQNINNHRYYFDPQNAWALRDWQYLGNHWHYFDPNQTWMDTGWQYLGNRWFYFDHTNGNMLSGFQSINGKIYFLNDKHDGTFGAMATMTGWQYLNKTWYYFNNDNTLKTDWLLSNGRWFYFDHNHGNMLSGLQTINGKTYFLNEQHDGNYGAMLTGQRKVGNNWYVFGNDGAARQGWVNGQYYGKNGIRYQNKSLTEGQNVYYFDQNGNQIRNQIKNVNGENIYFDNNGVGNISSLSHAVATAITNKDSSKDIRYDWTNQDHNYEEFAVHDMANLLSGNNVQNDAQVIEKLFARNDLLQGTVVSSQVYDLSKNADIAKLITQFVNGLPAGNYNDAVVGTSYNSSKHQLAIILFKPGKTTTNSDQTTSTIHSNVQDVYKAPHVDVDVDNGLTKGQAIDSDDAKAILTTLGFTTLLTGQKGQIISQEVLKTIFSDLPGNTDGLVGTKTYKHGNDSYHYVYWLEGQSADDKLQNFLNANKNAKYGDPLTVNYSATLTYGPGVKDNTAAIDETPTSKKTADEISLAYQKGTETGLRYDGVKVEKIPGMTDDMIRGVDISSYQSLINAGVKFYDFNGHEANLFKVLKDAGVNWVRLRLWNDPYNSEGQGYGGGNNDEASLVQMATEASHYGLKVLVDFHYSDFWADPAKQPLPKAWQNLSSSDLNLEISLYTRKVLHDLKNAGANVQMVQVGNEVTNGAFGIWTNRDRGGNWATTWESSNGTKVAKYLATAASAVRASAPQAKIAIQLETPNISKYRSIMTVLRNNNVDYDYLGTSYYPFWSTHDGNSWYDNVDLGYGASTPINLEAVEKMAQKEFGKKVVVLETSWLNNVNDADGTGNSISENSEIQAYSHDPQGQVNAMSDMYKALVKEGGVGAFYWEPAWIPVKAGWQNWEFNKQMSNIYGTGWASKYAIGYAPDSVMYYNGKPTWGGTTWDNNTLFDDHGYPLQSLHMYNGFLNGYQSPQSTTSSINVRVTALYKTDGIKLKNPLTVGSKLNLKNPISGEGADLLNGIQGTAISNASLQEIFNDLQDGINSATYTDNAGQKYHYEFYLVGNTTQEKLNNFLAANKGIKYGNPLNINYSATLIKDNDSEVNVTSPIKATVSEEWGLDGVKIDNPLKVGDSLPVADVAAIQNTVNKTLTGAKGTTISSQTFMNLAKQLPGVTSGLAGKKVYTVNGNQYHYVYWLKPTDIQAANKGAKYGDPIALTYSASLKWIDPKNNTITNS